MNDVREKFDSLVRYRDALPDGDREVFDRLVQYAQGHVDACAKANSLTVLESMLLTMLLEQQKTIEQMVTQS